MSHKSQMRRYIIAFCVLSVFHFVLAAPVSIGEMLEVRNAVDALKRGPVWGKRMDNDEENNGWSTNEAYVEVHQKFRNNNPGGDPKPDDGGYNSDDIEGYNTDDMFKPESPWDPKVMGSDARGPDPYYNNPKEDYSDDEVSSANPGDKDGGAKPNNKDDVGNSGYDGDSDTDGDRSGQGLTEYMNLGPELEPEPEPEPEHPATATPEHMTDLEKLSRLRPRNSGSNTLGTPKGHCS